MRTRGHPQMQCLDHEMHLSEAIMPNGCGLAWTQNRVECTVAKGPERSAALASGRHGGCRRSVIRVFTPHYMNLKPIHPVHTHLHRLKDSTETSGSSSRTCRQDVVR